MSGALPWQFWLFFAVTIAYAVASIMAVERQNRRAAEDYRRRMDDRLRRLANGECPPPVNRLLRK